MKKITLFTCIASIIISFNTFTDSLACTDFRIKAKDGTVLITRSMEFALDLQSNVRTSPRGRQFDITMPDGKPGMKWKAKYGYIFLDAMDADVVCDGMNEAGLSMEALFFPKLADYQQVPAGKNSQALPYVNIGDWILGNFKTVDEVRNALPNIFVVDANMPQFQSAIFPLHFSIFDASGKGIVVEYIKGKLYIYDNIGVMTNSPGYTWHITNLENYLHLAPINPPAVAINGTTFLANGQGFGMIGLPGDISPPSRFVKTATLLHVAVEPNNALESLNLAEHIINNVDIPLGLAREPTNGNYSNELTQWVVFKDLTHKMFYYRTYYDMSLHSISLASLNFEENAPRLKMPIAHQEQIQNVTDAFLQSAKNKVAMMSSSILVTYPHCKKDLAQAKQLKLLRNFIYL